MIIGRSLKYQNSDLLCRMYYCGDREVFEFYRKYDRSIPVSRHEHPFLESLLLFLEMDHASDFPQLNQIENDLTEYRCGTDRHILKVVAPEYKARLFKRQETGQNPSRNQQEEAVPK